MPSRDETRDVLIAHMEDECWRLAMHERNELKRRLSILQSKTRALLAVLDGHSYVNYGIPTNADLELAANEVLTALGETWESIRESAGKEDGGQ